MSSQIDHQVILNAFKHLTAWKIDTSGTQRVEYTLQILNDQDNNIPDGQIRNSNMSLSFFQVLEKSKYSKLRSKIIVVQKTDADMQDDQEWSVRQLPNRVE